MWPRCGDSSDRRTSPSLPAQGCLVIVRRCAAITASEYLALVLRSTQAVDEPRSNFFPATNSSLHSPLCDSGQLTLLRSFNVPSISYSGRG
jgi:hypothetical protein